MALRMPERRNIRTSCTISCDPMPPHATPCDLVRSAHMPEKQNMPICEVTWLQSRVLPAAVRALLSAARMAMMRSAIWLHSARHCASSLGSPSTWLGLGLGVGVGAGLEALHHALCRAHPPPCRRRRRQCRRRIGVAAHLVRVRARVYC